MSCRGESRGAFFFEGIYTPVAADAPPSAPRAQTRLPPPHHSEQHGQPTRLRIPSRRILRLSVSASALLASAVALAGDARFIAIPGLGTDPGANPSGCYVNATNGYSAIRFSADGQVVTTTAYQPGYSAGAVPRFVTRWTEAGGLRFNPREDGLIAWIRIGDAPWTDLQDYLIAEQGLGAELEGWRLESVEDISADGRTIVGSGINPEGCEQGFLVRIDLPNTNDIADMNGDGSVNSQDLLILLSAWGSSGGPADMNRDGIVNSTDLTIMLSRWSF